MNITQNESQNYQVVYILICVVDHLEVSKVDGHVK